MIRQWKDARQFAIAARVCWLARERGFHLVNADATIILERPKLRDHIAAMRESLPGPWTSTSMREA